MLSTINTEKNTRMNITIPKDLKAELEKEAKEDLRSLNNYIISILKERHNKK